MIINKLLIKKSNTLKSERALTQSIKIKSEDIGTMAEEIYTRIKPFVCKPHAAQLNKILALNNPTKVVEH